MALDLNNLAGDVASTTAKYKGEEIKLRYKPSAATPARLKAMTSTDLEGDDEIDAFTNFLADTLVSWDIKAGTKKVPVTVAGIETVPMTILQAIMGAIVGDQGDSGEQGSSSDGG